ncbi:MAG: trehalose-6-phosphate synthase [Sorangiineae bacterium NIC37A_2]|nr:MAG: trehalose-6-phosphate synthase [Sorangiineae bacterium NIC37A_2]
MRPAKRFLIGLLAGLALLSFLAHFVASRVVTGWFEQDLARRSVLLLRTVGSSLDSSSDPATRLPSALGTDPQSSNSIGGLLCSTSGDVLARVGAFPEDISCSLILSGSQLPSVDSPLPWTLLEEKGGRWVHVSAAQVKSGNSVPLTLALAEDVSFLHDRIATLQLLFFTLFVTLAVATLWVSLLATREAFQRWMGLLRESISGTPLPLFQPIMREVHSLAERIVSERERDKGGLWGPERLRATLTEHLHGERIVILANREPYIHENGPDGVHVVHPASGLVTALEPVMKACSGVWVAHGAGSADRETVDGNDRVLVPPGEESYMVRRVWLTDEEENGYYYGFSNEGLWPLCHVAHTRPVFRAEDYAHYVRVNQKFADAVCEEVDSEDPIILVQDYHFALAPAMIRQKLPRATIITFWHIPWPNAERIGICPWHEELITGLLGSSVVGFHTQQHCNNFIDSVGAFLESRIDREDNAVIQGTQKTLIRPYPISIEWPVHWLDNIPKASEVRGPVREELGLRPDARLGVGIDRLDYTKGIEERLQAVDELLTHHPEFRGNFSFVQLAAPSRTKIARYRELNERVEALAQEINAKWSEGTYRPIILLRSHHEPATVFRYYRAADLCYVSSLHDGMNLVAKEFVAARDDEQGVLVLSQFTGAARDLTEALIVNPYDFRQAGDALATALHMSPDEQRARMQSMRKVVSEFNVCRWAGRMLVDAAELRRKERMNDQLVSSTTRAIAS